MADRAKEKRAGRIRRHMRVRKRVKGTAERPRMAVYRSLEHIYVQVIDDVKGQTLVSASTIDAELRKQVEGKKKSEAARLVGQAIAVRARQAGVTRVVFDRGGSQYQGRIKALADAAREAGLEF